MNCEDVGAVTEADRIMAFLTARYNELAWWATRASRHQFGDHSVPPGGEHWRWECSEHDEVLKLDPLTQEHLECPNDPDTSARVSLRSVEEYGHESEYGPLPTFALPYLEEVPVAVAGHIVRHDPAAVLADIEAKRQIVKEHQPDGGAMDNDVTVRACGTCGDGYTVRWPCRTVRLVLLPFAGHPDYDQAWAP